MKESKVAPFATWKGFFRVNRIILRWLLQNPTVLEAHVSLKPPTRHRNWWSATRTNDVLGQCTRPDNGWLACVLVDFDVIFGWVEYLPFDRYVLDSFVDFFNGYIPKSLMKLLNDFLLDNLRDILGLVFDRVVLHHLPLLRNVLHPRHSLVLNYRLLVWNVLYPPLALNRLSRLCNILAYEVPRCLRLSLQLCWPCIRPCISPHTRPLH